MPSITCVHALYNNTIINTKTCCQNIQSCMCIYLIQQPKHKHKVLLQKCPVLHVYIPSIHIYIPSTTTQSWTKSLFPKIPSLTCVHTLYNNTDIKKARRQNAQSYMCTYPLQQHINKHKGQFTKFPVLHVYTSYKTIQT